ncbi:MAG: T9SS type A sorting domain-containing protein [Ginsengibacter sp.]
MKLKLLLSLLLSAFLFKSYSQDNRAFAITGQVIKNFNWTDIRVIDMHSGNMKTTLFENGKSKFSFVDAETSKAVDVLDLKGNAAIMDQNGNTSASNGIALKNPSPTMLMSAAAAYDKRHDRLFFSSMRTSQLMWLDTKQNNGVLSFFTVKQPLINIDSYNDESLNITRMTIGADGNGYALTNDGNHLVRFTTGKKIIITDLGNLVDAESNNGISIHNKCSSWGGDIVGDAFGKLYLFTATRNVFVIDINTRIATYKGSILNLSPTYTVNGAAVDSDNKILISSANTFEGFYKVDIKDFSSTKVITEGEVFNASDLASSYLLNETDKQNSVGAPSLINSEVIGNRYISVYPNPVSNWQFKITFDNNPAGKYKIALTDLQGRLISIKVVYIKAPGQVENFQLQKKQATGMYMIKITDAVNKAVFADKLVVQ